TNYFETVPSNQVETMFWLESDRMGFLLDSVTQTKFEVQRATVKNERGQRYDNSPYGLDQEKIGEALFPQAHPYSWTTIGYIEDLNRVDVNDLKRFYMRWYGPNNATLTVAGDVSTAQVVKLAEKYFGSIPRGPEVKAQKLDPVKLSEDRYISYEDEVKFPQVRMVWPTVPYMDKDEAPLDYLAWVLSRGKSSLFHTRLEKTQKAISANANSIARELAGQFEITIRANKDGSLAEMEKEVRQLLSDWENKGMQDEEILRQKAGFQSGFYNRLATVRGKGGRLAEYQTFRSNPNMIAYEYNRYMKVTKEDVVRVYNTYIKNQKAVILSCVPKGKGNLKAAEDTWKMYTRNIQKESAEYQNLSYNPPKDNFDRTKQPQSGKSPVVHIPEYWTENFANGAKLIGTFSGEIPKVNIQLSFYAGHRFDPIEKSGLAFLATDLMNESTQLHSAEQISDMLEKLGATVDVSANNNEVVVYISTMKQNVDATLKIAEEILFKPKFDETEFERVKKELLNLIAQQNATATAIADKVFSRLLFGEKEVLSLPMTGTEETVKQITLDDIKKFYKERFSPATARVVITGDISKEQAIPKLNFIKNWTGAAAAPMVKAQGPSIDKTRIYFVNKKGAPQSELRAGYLSLPYDATGEYYKSTIMDFPFGASFNGRVNLLLREKRGYTYGARATYQGGILEGYFGFATGVRANATDSALVDYIHEMKDYADKGITDGELSFTRHSMGQADALKYEAPQQKAGFMKRLLDYNLKPSYVKEQNLILESISMKDINSLAKKNLDYEHMVIVVVGDKESNLEKVKKLGYEVVELDVNGNPVK
ncbi:MAG: M16 family metallopeptidase, partial [Bacteroidia bacterium]